MTVTEEVQTVRVSIDVPASLLDDILAAAFEGGINDWCNRVVLPDPMPLNAEYASEVPGLGSFLLLEDDEDRHTLNAAKLTEGILRWVMEHELSNIDAGVADTIVQYSVLGEVRYG